MNSIRMLRSQPALAALALFLGAVLAPVAYADVLIQNGGFESGFTGWTRVDQVEIFTTGTFALQSGTASPVLMETVPAPPGGMFAAMTDADGPGAHVLYQDFVVPNMTIGEARLRFDLFIGNRNVVLPSPPPPAPPNTNFFTPNTLNFAPLPPALNQQARVDILRPGTNPFSVAASDVLLNIYQTRPNDALISGYTTITADLTALLNANRGQTLRLRFAETDNVAPFQFGVDNVSLVAIPEPASLVLFGLGALGVLGRHARRRTARG